MPLLVFSPTAFYVVYGLQVKNTCKGENIYAADGVFTNSILCCVWFAGEEHPAKVEKAEG